MRFNRNSLMWTVATASLVIVSGCASYATPGRAVDLKALGAVGEAQTDAGIEQALAKRPLAIFPTGIAIARVQAPCYQSQTVQTWGTGRYCVVLNRDIEKEDQVQRISKLPMVSGIVPIGRLMLPETLNSDLELRQSAAALHADMLLIYTLDTTFQVEDKAAPLTVVTLGLSPNQQARVLSTASAVLLDTRNGYVYGIAEATEHGGQLTSAWTSEAAVDQARRRTEAAAFEKLVGELEKTWAGVLKSAAPAAASAE